MSLDEIALFLALICAIASFLVLVIFHHQGKKKVKNRAACDLLDYASLVSDHVIALKNGALMQIFELHMQDLSFADENHLAHVREMVFRALLKLGGNYAIHLDAKRQRVFEYLPKASDKESLVHFFDEYKSQSLKKQHSLYTTRFYLSLTKLGDKTATRALAQIMTEKEDSKALKNAFESTKALVESFESECRAVTDTLSLVLKVRPLSFIKDEKGLVFHEGISYIYQAFSGITQQVQIPKARTYLDAIIGAQDVEVSFTPKVGEQYKSVIAIEGVPSSVNFLILKALATLPCEYRFNTRYISFDYFKSAFLLERYRRFWKQRQRGLISQIFNTGHNRLNLNAVEKVHEIDAEKARLDDRKLNFGSYCATVVLSDPNFNKLGQYARLVLRKLEDLGFTCRIETVNAMEAFLGSLPGHIEENVRRPMVNHEVLTDLLPLSYAYCGETRSPHEKIGDNQSPLVQCQGGAGKGVFYLNLHDKDLANTLVIGPPGSGKSVLLGDLMLNFLRYKNARVFAFDKGWSFYALAKASLGEHVCFDNSKSDFCPLQFLDTPQDLDQSLDFVETLLRLSGLEVDATLRLELIEALKLLALRSQDKRSLSDLHLLLSSRVLKEALEPYTLKANEGSLLDGLLNPSFQNKLTVFECSTLFSSSKRFMIPVLKHLFRLIERSFDGNPIAIVVDEAWMMLEEPYFARELLKWFKTLRKHNVFVILATQSLSDLANTTYFESFLDCAKTRIFLSNFDAQGEVLSKIYQKMGLNDRQIEMIAKLESKSEYFLKKGSQSAIFKLFMTPTELKLLSFAGDHIVKEVDALYESFGADLGLGLKKHFKAA